MRILIAVTSYLSYRLIQGQIKFLTSQGHEVYFCSSYSDNINKNIIKEGGMYINLNLDREINIFKDLIYIFKAYNILRKVKPDIINISTAKSSFIFSIASLFYGNTIVVHTLRGLRSDTLYGLKYYIVSLTERLSCSIANKIIVISPSLEVHAKNRNIIRRPNSIVFGHGSSNGIDLKRFSLSKKLEIRALNFRKQYSISDDEFVFGYVGRLNKDKGITELYNAFLAFKARRSNVKLLIVGSTEDINKVEPDILDLIDSDPDVERIGYMPDIETALAVLDVLILYSYREGFGNTVIEAAALSKPAIVANIPGLRDTIEDGKTGLLCEPKNHFALLDCMIEIYDNKLIRNEMGINARQRVLKWFSNEFIWSCQLDMYNYLISTSSKYP